MKPEQQRIAIAKAEGYQHYHEDLWVDPKASGDPDGFSELQCGSLPDYLNDLNAMHEAELVFVGEGKSPNYYEYRQRLYQICCLSPELAVRATAAQRAEAFLRTIGKWEDTND